MAIRAWQKRTTQKKSYGKGSGARQTKFGTGRVAVAKKGWSQKVATLAPEVKYVDSNVNATPTNVVGFTLMNGCFQGTSDQTRIGTKIQAKGLVVTGTIMMPVNVTGGTTDVIRLGVLFDKQTDGVAPVSTDVWDNALGTGFVVDHRNLDTAERYVILRDMKIAIGQVGPASAYFEMYIPFEEVTKFNNGVSGTVSDIVTGSVYFYQVSTASVSTCAMRANLRYKFVDP